MAMISVWKGGREGDGSFAYRIPSAVTWKIWNIFIPFMQGRNQKKFYEGTRQIKNREILVYILLALYIEK